MGFEAIDIKNNEGFQDIRIPKEMKINDDKVFLRKIGNVIYVIPFHSPWQNFVESLDTFTSDFMENRDQPAQDSREHL